MKRSFVIGTAAIVLASCASISDPEDAIGIAADALPEIEGAWRVEGARGPGEVAAGWIDALGDETLSAFAREAVANNRDLRAAAAAVDEARALALQAGAALVPAVDITASGARGGVVEFPSAPSYTVGLQLGWEADVWGRVRATQRAAAFGAYSAEADFLFTQYAIVAAIARAYFIAIEAGLQMDVAEASLAALEQTDVIVKAQRDIGVASGLDVALSKRDLANARDSLLQAQVGRRIAIRALEVLLGRYPGAAFSPRETLPQTPPAPPPGLPSTLLERRPDIIAAQLAVAAAFNNVSAAEAARLPAISLTSTIGGSSTELGDVLDPENVAWQVAGNLIGPLFDGGLRLGRAREARAEREQAANAFAQSALTAFEEVETSLDQLQTLRARETALAEAADQAQLAFRLAQVRYQEGETNLLDVLIIQNNAFAADSALVAVQRALLEEWVILNLALGGGWEKAAGPATRGVTSAGGGV